MKDQNSIQMKSARFTAEPLEKGAAPFVSSPPSSEPVLLLLFLPSAGRALIQLNFVKPGSTSAAVSLLARPNMVRTGW